MTGRDRVSTAAVLDWCFELEKYCTRAFLALLP
jgi:hypothetical protein